MMKRPKTGSFPNLHVFPGGAMDADDPSLEFCALRETFEETGLLINPKTKQSLILPRKQNFRQAVANNFKDFVPKLDPVSEWTTPQILAAGAKKNKRFTTQFFLYQSNNEPEFLHFEPDKEVISLVWVTPHECLSKFTKGEIQLYPPQFYLMNYLSKLPVNDVVERLKNRVVKPVAQEKLNDKIVMDWGEGEQGLLTFKDGAIKLIEFHKSKL